MINLYFTGIGKLWGITKPIKIRKEIKTDIFWKILFCNIHIEIWNKV